MCCILSNLRHGLKSLLLCLLLSLVSAQVALTTWPPTADLGTRSILGPTLPAIGSLLYQALLWCDFCLTLAWVPRDIPHTHCAASSPGLSGFPETCPEVSEPKVTLPSWALGPAPASYAAATCHLPACCGQLPVGLLLPAFRGLQNWASRRLRSPRLL